MHSGVITADIVNSTSLDNRTEKQFTSSIKKILSPLQFEFYRGDSLQIFVKNAGQCLHIVILLRALAKKTEIKKNRFDFKTSIGIGDVKKPVKDIRTAKGQAFLLSGRGYDTNILLKQRNFTILCGKEPFDTAFEILADYVDDIFRRLTPKQAAIVYELAIGHTQLQIAKRLKKTQPTISKLANTAGWDRLQELLIKFERLIKLLS